MWTLELWWGTELGVSDAWRWHFTYHDLETALSSQLWHEYRAGIPARLVTRVPQQLTSSVRSRRFTSHHSSFSLSIARAERSGLSFWLITPRLTHLLAHPS